jgi:hypothetical protein
MAERLLRYTLFTAGAQDTAGAGPPDSGGKMWIKQTNMAFANLYHYLWSLFPCRTEFNRFFHSSHRNQNPTTVALAQIHCNSVYVFLFSMDSGGRWDEHWNSPKYSGNSVKVHWIPVFGTLKRAAARTSRSIHRRTRIGNHVAAPNKTWPWLFFSVKIKRNSVLTNRNQITNHALLQKILRFFKLQFSTGNSAQFSFLPSTR